MNYEKIGAFIAKKRKEQHLTQKDIAEKLGLTDRAVSRWERGIGCPDISYLEEIANMLQISILELLHGEEITTKEEENKSVEQLLKVKRKEQRKWKYSTLLLLNVMMLFLFTSILSHTFIVNLEHTYEEARETKKYSSLYVPIISSSMLQELKMQDIIKIKKVTKKEDIQKEDIITFFRKDDHQIITHRVVQVIHENGETKFQTKGDSNYYPDKDYVEYQDVIGKMSYKLPIKYNIQEKNILIEIIKYIFVIAVLLFDIIIIIKKYLQHR